LRRKKRKEKREREKKKEKDEGREKGVCLHRGSRTDFRDNASHPGQCQKKIFSKNTNRIEKKDLYVLRQIVF